MAAVLMDLLQKHLKMMIAYQQIHVILMILDVVSIMNLQLDMKMIIVVTLLHTVAVMMM